MVWSVHAIHTHGLGLTSCLALLVHTLHTTLHRTCYTAHEHTSTHATACKQLVLHMSLRVHASLQPVIPVSRRSPLSTFVSPLVASLRSPLSLRIPASRLSPSLSLRVSLRASLTQEGAGCLAHRPPPQALRCLRPG